MATGNVSKVLQLYNVHKKYIFNCFTGYGKIKVQMKLGDYAWGKLEVF